MLENLKQRLDGRKLLGVALENCKFRSSVNSSSNEVMNEELLFELCQYAYSFKIYSCKFDSCGDAIKNLVTNVVQTSAHLTELTICIDDFFNIEM